MTELSDEKKAALKEKFRQAINYESVDADLDTADHFLADFLVECLAAVEPPALQSGYFVFLNALDELRTKRLLAGFPARPDIRDMLTSRGLTSHATRNPDGSSSILFDDDPEK